VVAAAAAGSAAEVKSIRKTTIQQLIKVACMCLCPSDTGGLRRVHNVTYNLSWLNLGQIGQDTRGR